MAARLHSIAVLAAIAAAGSPAVAREGQGQEGVWKIAPDPGWVVPAPVAPAEPDPSDESVSHYLLDDTQVRVSGKGTEHYRHLRYRPRSPAQVEDGSQLEIEFNPAFERLVIHHARVERKGRAVATLARREVKVLQREKGLEERIYDGTLSALIFLHDVRVGDVVDYAYSVEGENPVLGGKYVTTFPLGDRSFTAYWRRRILLPEARSLTIRKHGTDLDPAVTTGGGLRVYAWERRDIPPIEIEDGLPSWFDAAPSIEASEFTSWAEVAAGLARTFESQPRPSSGLSAQIAKLRAMEGSAEDRLLEATRFVQDDIRYLGIELGLGGYRPFAPATVLERRFGDCKDKSVLLVTLLRALGLEAKTALVNTIRRRALDDRLPSPLAFDHAIVRVAVGGQSVFIDPTASYQRGPLSVRQPPDLERALILAPETRGLISIPRPRLAEPDHVMRETITIGADNRGAELEVETTSHGDGADRARALFAARTRKELGRDYLNYYSKDDPSVTQTADLQVVDDERRNVFTVRERYHIAEVWKDQRRELDATIVGGHLVPPRVRLRRMPYALEFPLHVRSETLVRFPTRTDAAPEMRDIGDDHLHFRFETHVSGRELSIRYELESLDDWVAPAKAPRFFQVQDEIRRRAGYVLRAPGVAIADDLSWFKTPPGVSSLILMGAVPLAGLALGGRALWRRAKRRRFRRQHRFASGETAATAIEVASGEDLGTRVGDLRCACGARYPSGSSVPAENVRYDGRTLAVWALECKDCRRRRSVFFAVSGQS